MSTEKFSIEDCSTLLAGRIASEGADMVEKVVSFITEELADKDLEIKPIFLLGGHLNGEAQALIEQTLRKVFQGVDPLTVAMEILTNIFVTDFIDSVEDRLWWTT